MTLQAIHDDWHAALAALAWQVEMGVTDALAEAPVDRFALTETVAQVPRVPAQAGTSAVPADPVAEAAARAAGAATLEELAAAMAGFEGSPLKRGARNFVFADGNPAARVMVVGEAPGAEEDRAGRPFAGAAGQLLDRMLAAIGLARTAPDPGRAVYLTTALPWRVPQDRPPAAGEIALFRPFLARHIVLADPEVLVVFGNVPLMALSGTQGIARLRGRWSAWEGRPLMPMVHPAALLRNPLAKREAWADLLALEARLG